MEGQAGNIAAAEAGIKYTLPAAFSFPEENTDEILRTGGGMKDSRTHICPVFYHVTDTFFCFFPCI